MQYSRLGEDGDNVDEKTCELSPITTKQRFEIEYEDDDFDDNVVYQQHSNLQSNLLNKMDEDMQSNLQSNQKRNLCKRYWKWIAVIFGILLIVAVIVIVVMVLQIGNDKSNETPSGGLDLSSFQPTSEPTILINSNEPTNTPINGPFSPSPEPTPIATKMPSVEPTTNNPSNVQTRPPTQEPSMDPTNLPSLEPTIDPTLEPTSKPTQQPIYGAHTGMIGGDGGQLQIYRGNGDFSQRLTAVSDWELVTYRSAPSMRLKNFTFGNDTFYTQNYSDHHDVDTVCNPFKLDSDEYINRYKVQYSNVGNKSVTRIIGLGFKTNENNEYSCDIHDSQFDGNFTNIGWASMNSVDCYLYGMDIRSGDIMDSIDLYFSGCTSQTFDPTNEPTGIPTFDPTPAPSNHPTMPTIIPSIDPTTNPSVEPTVEPTTEPTNIPTTDPTFEPTKDPTSEPTSVPTVSPTDFLPVPGELYVINGTNDSFTVHNSTVYLDPIDLSECIMNTNGNNKLLNSSYISMKYSNQLDNATFLIATKNNWDLLPANCTQFPALKIVNREYYENEDVLYSKLFVIEAYFWEYFETLDVNMSNITMTNQTQFTPTDDAMSKQFADDSDLTDVAYDTQSISSDNMTDLYGDMDDGGRRRLAKWKKTVSLSIKPEFQTKISAGDLGNGVGLELKTGADFECKFSFSFVCSFDIIKGFNKLKVVAGISSSLSAYVKILINTVRLQAKILDVSDHVTIFVAGIIPIDVKFYGTLWAGVEVRDIDLHLQYKFGYNTVAYKFGVEYTKKHGWKKISESADKWPWFQEFSYSLDTSHGCEYIITPYVEFRTGILFEWLVNVYESTVLQVPITLSYPSTVIGCGFAMNECDSTLNALGIEYELWDELYIGYKVQAGDYFDIYSPDPKKLGQWKIGEWDDCFDIDSAYLFDVCCNNGTMKPTKTEIVVTDQCNRIGCVTFGAFLCLLLFIAFA